MKVTLVSDLHVDMNSPNPHDVELVGRPYFYPWNREKNSDLMIIAGDTSNNFKQTPLVILEAAEHFEHVLWVSGNHSFYFGQKTGHTVGMMEEEFVKVQHPSRQNVMYLYDWRAYPFASRNQQHEWWKSDVSDAKRIRFDSGGYADKLAAQHAELLADKVRLLQYDTTCEEIVIITHTVPIKTALYPLSHKDSYLNGTYCNTMMEGVWLADTAKKIKTWCFGHTHVRHDFWEH